MSHEHDPRLIVITGGSGTGKSTLAKALQEQFLPDTWLRFSVDAVLECLPSSLLDSVNLRNDWSLIDRQGIKRSAYACLSALLDDGNRVLFECVVMTEPVARGLLVALRPHRPVLIGLTCALEETRRRTLARRDRTLEEAELGFKTAALHLQPDHAVDTTACDSVQTARELIASMRRQPQHDAWELNLARYLQSPQQGAHP